MKTFLSRLPTEQIDPANAQHSVINNPVDEHPKQNKTKSNP